MTLPDGTRLDGYRVDEHLADGAEAEVYRGTDIVSGEPVVLKIPHTSTITQPILATRWRREVRLLDGIEHERIQCRVDRGRRHARPYLALEYVPGGSVRTWLSSADPLPIDQAVVWGTQVTEALGYLHRQGIVHRDLKPENLLVTADLDVKLGDFGAAAKYSARFPWHPPEPPEGTAGYLSPEVAAGNRGDPRSDVYGWGVLMYELLTGEMPFRATTTAALMEAPLRDQPRPPRELRPDISPALEAVVLTAMRRRPEHRYRDMEAVAADLKRLDELDVSGFDLGPEPEFSVGGTELRALVRFAAVVSGTFVAFAAIVILLSWILR